MHGKYRNIHTPTFSVCLKEFVRWTTCTRFVHFESSRASWTLPIPVHTEQNAMSPPNRSSCHDFHCIAAILHRCVTSAGASRVPRVRRASGRGAYARPSWPICVACPSSAGRGRSLPPPPRAAARPPPPSRCPSTSPWPSAWPRRGGGVQRDWACGGWVGTAGGPCPLTADHLMDQARLLAATAPHSPLDTPRPGFRPPPNVAPAAAQLRGPLFRSW